MTFRLVDAVEGGRGSAGEWFEAKVCEKSEKVGVYLLDFADLRRTCTSHF